MSMKNYKETFLIIFSYLVTWLLILLVFPSISLFPFLAVVCLITILVVYKTLTHFFNKHL